MNERLRSASVVADLTATFEERLSVAEDLFVDLMATLDEMDQQRDTGEDHE
jgi:hypothetical protein